MEEYWDFETDRALQVTLPVSCPDKPTRDVVVVTGFGTLRFIIYKLLTADVAPRCIIIFFLLAGTKALHSQIRPENRNNLCFPYDKRVKKLGECVFSDFHHSSFVKVIKTRGENGRCGAYFVLLGVGSPFHLATGRLKNGLEVSIDNDWRLYIILVLVEFDLRLFRAWSRKHMKHRQKVLSSAKLFVASDNFLR